MQLVSDEPEFKELLLKLEGIVQQNIHENGSVKAFRAYVSPVTSQVHYDKRLVGVVAGSGGTYLIALKLDENTTILSDVAGPDPMYITFRRNRRLVAIMGHRQFLDRLYVNEMIRTAIAQGEIILGEGEVNVMPPALAVLDTEFRYANLDAAVRKEFGCGLNVAMYGAKSDVPMLQPMMDTPPIALSDAAWESGQGWKSLKIPAMIREVPLERLLSDAARTPALP